MTEPTLEFEYQCPRCLARGRINIPESKLAACREFLQCPNGHDIEIEIKDGEWKGTYEHRR